MTTSIIRTALLLVLSLTALSGLFAAAEHIAAAPVSLAAGYLAARLYRRWSATDRLIAAYNRWCLKSY